MAAKPRVGISACLLGERVRWDGGHKLAGPLVEALAGRVDWVAVCPEVELGLGAPREPMSLVRRGDGTRLVVNETGRDLTDTMRAFVRARVEGLRAEALDGFVLKSRSPSCGLAAPVGADDAAPGLFASELRARLPELPVTEETDLATADDRERWLARVIDHYRRRRRRA
jgi:uncharacterized protein YbbK (DUF523 family)